MKLILIICAGLLSASAFKMPAARIARRSVLSMRTDTDAHAHAENELEMEGAEFNPFQFSPEAEKSISMIPILAAAIPFLMSDPAFAAASDWGIFAGRTASLMHPFTNFALFGTSLYSAYLGWNWRRLRNIGEEIKELNKQLPKLSSGPSKSPLSEMVSSISAEISSLGEGNEAAATLTRDLELLKGAFALDAQISELSATRKALLGKNLKDKHQTTGSILLGAGVTVSILGAFNTYMRAGKLFPGPHLYAGMAITILWAVAASLVPAMQKGNEAARTAHIAANVANIILFAWQIPTGIEILLKVIEKTSWP